MEKIIFLCIVILCFCIIFLSPIYAEPNPETAHDRRVDFIDILTDEEKIAFQDLVNAGVITQENLHIFVDRFMRSPKRETAFDQALRGGFSANFARELHSIKRVFVEPAIGIKVLEEHYREHGPVRGTLRIALNPVTIPVQSWGEIWGGQPGLGEYPLKILVGAMSVILWGVLILSKQTKQTKYNWKAALARLAVVIPIIIFIVYSIIDGLFSGLTFVLYAVLFLGIQYLIICLVLYPIILLMYRYVILWIYRGLKG